MLALLLLLPLIGDDPKTKKADAKLDAPNRIVLWNMHNGPIANAGTSTAHVYLFVKGSIKPILEKKNVVIPWDARDDKPLILPYTLPKGKKLSRVRVEIITFRDAGGLSEIQVYQNGDLISEGCLATVSAISMPDDARNAAALTDGITNSNDEFVGYWLLPAKKQGWAEVDLTRTKDGKLIKKK